MAIGAKSFSQVPEAINYQAVARNASSGEAMAGKSLFILIKIMDGPNGDILYQETHENIYTNEYGLFGMEMGNGNVQQGVFSYINWGSGNVWISISIDAGEGLDEISLSKMFSVPYALYAKNVANRDDADADPENELIDSFMADNEMQTLTLNEGAQSHTVSLSEMFTEEDGSISNELQDIEIQGDSAISLSQSSISVPIDMSTSNELIESLQFDSSNNQLSISEGGSNFMVDLGSMAEPDDDWVKTEDFVYNSSENIGIGTENPEARLEVSGTNGDGEEILRINNNEGAALLQVRNDTVVSINTERTTASTNIGGSVSVNVKKVDFNDGFILYQVKKDDYVIIAKNPNLTDHPNIYLPNVFESQGRIIKIIAIVQGYPSNRIQVRPQVGQMMNYPTNAFDMRSSSDASLRASFICDGEMWHVLSSSKL